MNLNSLPTKADERELLGSAWQVQVSVFCTAVDELELDPSKLEGITMSLDKCVGTLLSYLGLSSLDSDEEITGISDNLNQQTF